MQRVTRRIYGRDAEGRKVLLAAPGDVIDDAEAARLAEIAEPEPPAPEGWWTPLSRDDEPGEAPAVSAKPLDRMTLRELRVVCQAEGIDPAGANLRAEYVAVIEAARAAAGNSPER